MDGDYDDIPDDADRCPAQAEDRDNFEDQDGCPDPDNDGDGVPDVKDLCPVQPEDKDGFEDQDGCPDPDNDKDCIKDPDDSCPLLAEVYNGFEDQDGCPDPLAYDADRHGSFTDNLFTVRPIFFAEGSALLSTEDGRYLGEFARWLSSEPAVELLAVVGHGSTDEPHPAELGLKRARAVVEHLGRVISSGRLLALSAGTTPAAEWTAVTRPPWKDRSVHLRYLRVKGKEIYRWNGVTDVPADPQAGPLP